MKCYNCEHILPDDSEFCQYCGSKIEQTENIVFNTEQEEIDIEQQDNEKIDISLSEESVDNVKSKKAKKNIKKAFCSVCGGTIDKESKKCTGCGKQYFRGIRLKPLLNCIFGAIILVSLFFNIVQYISYTDLESEKSNVVSDKSTTETVSVDKKVAETTTQQNIIYPPIDIKA